MSSVGIKRPFYTHFHTYGPVRVSSYPARLWTVGRKPGEEKKRKKKNNLAGKTPHRKFIKGRKATVLEAHSD